MKKIFSFIFTISIIGFLVSHIARNWHELVLVQWNFGTNMVLFVSSLFVIYITNILSWHILLKYMHESVSFGDNARIWLFSNIIRMLPGGIWQYPSRIIMLNKSGVSKYKGTYAVMFELLFTLITGSALVTILLWWQFPQEIQQFKVIIVLLFLIPILLLFLITYQKSQKTIFLQLNALSKRSFPLIAIPFNLKLLLPVIVLFSMRFVTIGTSLYFLLNMVVPIAFASLPLIIGMYSLSWLLGYIVIFAPGGLGVTEGVLTILLSLLLPSAVAGSIAIVFRIFLLLTEAVLVIIFKFVEVSRESRKK